MAEFEGQSPLVELVKKALVQQRAYSLLRALAAMEERSRFVPNEQVEKVLAGDPEALGAYLKLIAETKKADEAKSAGQAGQRARPADVTISVEQRVGSVLGTITGVKIGDFISMPAPEEASTMEEPPPSDPQAYAPPSIYRHPAAIYCELGHYYFHQGERYLETRRGDLAWAQFAQAAQAYRDAIQQHRESAQLRYYLADALDRQQKPDEALRIILESIPLDFRVAAPALEKAHRWLTLERALALRNLEADWLSQAEAAHLDAANMASLYKFLGRVRLYQGDYSQAVSHYEKALETDPYDLFALEGYGMALWRLGETDQAIDLLRQAAKRADGTGNLERQEKTRLKLVDLLTETRQYAAAIDVIQRGLALEGPNQVFFQIALTRVHLAQSQYNEAKKEARQALRTDSTQPEAHALLAEACFRLEDYPAAVAAADDALARRPEYLNALKFKGGALLQEGREIDQATRLLEICLQRNPADGESQYLRIKGMRIQGKPAEEIVSTLKKALDIVTGEESVPLLIELAQAYLQAGKTAFADETIQSVNQIQPGIQSAQLAQLHGDALRQSGKPEAAIEYYEKGLSLEPHNTAIWRRMAEVQTETRDLKGGIQAWEHYLEASPDDLDAWIQLAQARARLKDWQGTLNAANTVLEHSLSRDQEIIVYRLKGDALHHLNAEPAEIVEAYYTSAQILRWNGNYADSNKLYDKIIDIDPNYVAAYWGLSDNQRILSYEADKEWLIQESLKTWNAGAKIRLPGQDDSWAYLTRALICEKLLQGQDVTPEEEYLYWWEAAAYTERALLRNDWYVYNWSYLGYYHRRTGMEATALAATKRAMEIDSENLSALGERAAILANTGQFKEADEVISNYLKKAPNESWAQGVKAYVLHRLGKYQEALEMIDKVLKEQENFVWNMNLKADCYRGMSHYDPRTLSDDWARKLDELLHTSAVPDTSQQRILEIAQSWLGKLRSGHPDEQKTSGWQNFLQPILEARAKALAGYRTYWEQAYQIYQQIWAKYERGSEEFNITNLENAGWAAYQLGKFPQAQKIFEKLQQPDEHGYIRRRLGLVLLARNDMKLGKETLFKGIASARNPRELNDFSNIDLMDVKNGYVIWPYSEDELERLLEQIDRKVSDRLKEVAEMPTPQQELQEKAEEQTRQGRKDSWVWITAQAGLARLYSSEQRWEEAAQAYLNLLTQFRRSLPPQPTAAQEALQLFPEARLGLEKTVDSLFAEAERAEEEGNLTRALEICKQILPFELALDRPDRAADLHETIGDVYCLFYMPAEALAQYNRAADFEPLGPDAEKYADLQARYTFAYFIAGDTGKLRQHYQQALERYRQIAFPNPAERIGQVCQALIADKELFWKLHDALHLWREEQGSGEELQADLAVSQQALVAYLDRVYHLPFDSPGAKKSVVPVPPVAVEIGQGLIPPGPIESISEWPLFKVYLPEMHNRIQARMGFHIPDIRFRGNQGDLLANNYLILLGEVPLVLGIVELDHAYCPQPVDALIQAGLHADRVKPAEHPGTGEPGCWVPREYWDALQKIDLELWIDPFQYVIAHLEGFLLRNCGEFLGIQEVDYLLQQGEQADKSFKKLVKSTLPDEIARYRFARLLKSLVKENVPVTRLREILEVARQRGLNYDDPQSILLEVRLRLKEQLPGNQRESVRIWLPEDLEGEIAKWVTFQDGKGCLALPYEETRTALDTIRGMVDVAALNQVLVTQRPELRLFVRRLVEIEFPNLMVLSNSEFLEPGQA